MAPPRLVIRPALQAFARELTAARVHAGISQVQLAKRAGMTRQGLRKIEGGGNVTLGTIVLLANVLGRRVSDFFPPNH